MGSFGGHALPGSIFFLFGAWWTVQVFCRYFQCRQTGKRFRSTFTFPCCCRSQRMRKFPFESVVRMVLCLVGIIVEFIGGIDHTGHFTSAGNGQHITMYFFYMLTGVFDILVQKGVAPEGSDYVSVIVALLVEGALFKFHLYGRSTLDTLLHTLLLYVIGLSVLVAAAEAACRKAPVLPLLRALLTLVQGTWFWGVGTILYNPLPGAEKWEHEDHHSLMVAVICFCWHVGINLLLMMAVGTVIGCCYSRRGAARYSTISAVPLNKLRRGGDGDDGSNEDDDNDEEDELGLDDQKKDLEAGQRGVKVYRDNDTDALAPTHGLSGNGDVGLHASAQK